MTKKTVIIFGSIMGKYIFVLGILMCFISCNKSERVFIDLSDKVELSSRNKTKNSQMLRISIGGIITPEEGYAYYQSFVDYLEKKLGTHIKISDRMGYAEINSQLKKKELDAAFICSGPYVDGHKQFGLELLVAPVAYGESVYYSYIIVNKESSFKKFDDLRGKSFAFTDPLSNTGKIAPTYMLKQIKETPESFFSKIVYTKTHDNSIKSVAGKLVDGAAVDSLIWEYTKKANPDVTSRTRIIKKSDPFGIPPFVVRQGLDKKLKKKIKDIFLAASLDPEAQPILKKMKIDRFIEINDSAYNSIRAMKNEIH